MYKVQNPKNTEQTNSHQLLLCSTDQTFFFKVYKLRDVMCNAQELEEEEKKLKKGEAKREIRKGNL